MAKTKEDWLKLHLENRLLGGAYPNPWIHLSLAGSPVPTGVVAAVVVVVHYALT